MEHQKRKLHWLAPALAGLFALLFAGLWIAVKRADVAAIGPGGTSVGLAGMNGAFAGAVGWQPVWYQISKWLGVLAIALAAGFALLGLWQWIARKSLGKVDRVLFALAGLYVASAAVYLLFEKVVVNCRPVLLEGETAPAASFPSSHTVLACVFFGSAVLLAGIYLKRRAWRLAAQIALCALLLLTVVARLLSGVHWLTDILAGLFLGGALLCLFVFVYQKIKPKE